jgi:[ribosomal protein S5]-alanine N-acetyltransferase
VQVREVDTSPQFLVQTTVPTLVGTRCTLRAFAPADAPSIARHADDAQVAFNLFDGFPQPYTLDLANAWCSDDRRPTAYGHVFAIDVGGEAIGSCSVTPEAGWLRCNAEVGYWIGRAFWRRGIGSEMLRLLSAWAWQALPDVTRLYAPIFERNEGSQGVARSAGYVLEGRMPQSAIKDGVLIDRVVYGLYRPR